MSRLLIHHCRLSIVVAFLVALATLTPAALCAQALSAAGQLPASPEASAAAPASPTAGGGAPSLLRHRDTDVSLIELKHRRWMGGTSAVVSLGAGIGLGVAAVVVARAADNDGVDLAAPMVVVAGTLVAGPSAAFAVGRGLGYKGSYGRALGRGTAMGLAGMGAGMAAGLLTSVALVTAQTCPKDDDGGHCHMTDGYTFAALGGLGGGVGYLVGMSKGSVRGFARGLPQGQAAETPGVVLSPTVLPTPQGWGLPGVAVSGRF